MDLPIALMNALFIAGLLGLTWWYARSTSRLLKQAQGQVSLIEDRAIAKIAELQNSYTQILQEIDERRQAEARLKESEARFAAFMRHVPGTAVILDNQGTRLFANDTWLRVFGGDGGEKERQAPSGPAAEPVCTELDRQVMEQGLPLERVETLTQNGKTHFWLVTRFPIPHPEGQPLMMGAIGIDITARREAEEALRKSEQKLRALAAQLLTAQENERKRLAAELHDELGHTLLSLKLRMESLEEDLTPQQVSLKGELKEILRVVGDTIAEVRRLYLDLSPGDLEDLGLTAALHSLIEEFASLKKDVTWTVKMDSLDGLLPQSMQVAVYRIIQEALTNIGKHAQPSHISLEIRRESQRLTFLIQDDGRGFDQERVLAEKKTLGLLSMEERVRIMGGSFELFSRLGQGTRITFSIPHGGSQG